MRAGAGGFVLTATIVWAAAASADGEPPTRGAGKGEPLPIGPPGLTVTVAPPEGWTPMTGDEAPRIDVSQVPGAGVSLRRGWSQKIDGPTPHENRLILVCAEAPSDHYVAGAESLVFDRMNALAKGELAKQASVERFDAYEVEAAGPRLEQRFEASGELAPPPESGNVGDRPASANGVRVGVEGPGRGPKVAMRTSGRHTLGFAGPSIAACTIACAEAEGRPEALRCPGVLASVAYAGPFGAAPTPGLAARVFLAAAGQPIAAASVAAGLLVIAVGLLLAFRPQTRE